MKTGLVMEGGAMRGIFTCGVLDVFMENGIEFNGAIGVSAGAVFGCNFKSRQIGRGVRYNKRFCNDKRYKSIKSLITTGDYFNTKFCYDVVPKELDVWDDETYMKNPMEFMVVCTDVETGEPFYKTMEGSLYDQIDYLRASASMPCLSKIVNIDGRKLLDGGVGDSIPIKYFESKGYDRNVVILTQPADFVKEPNGMLKFIKIMYRKYPKFIKAIADRHIGYNETLDYIKNKGDELFVIQPSEALNIKPGESNPDELERVYQMGRKIGNEKLEAVKRFLEK